MACVNNDVAVCQNGKWQTLDQCGQFQCLALPVLAGNGTVRLPFYYPSKSHRLIAYVCSDRLVHIRDFRRPSLPTTWFPERLQFDHYCEHFGCCVPYPTL